MYNQVKKQILEYLGPATKRPTNNLGHFTT